MSCPFGPAENLVILSIVSEHGMIYSSSYFMNSKLFPFQPHSLFQLSVFNARMMKHRGLFAATSQRCVQKKDPLIRFHAPVSESVLIFVLAANAPRRRHPCHQLSHRPRPGPQIQKNSKDSLARLCVTFCFSPGLCFSASPSRWCTQHKGYIDRTTPIRW